VVDALKAGQALDKVYLQQGTRGEMEIELRKLTKERGVPMAVVPREKLDKMVRGNHQGVIAMMASVAYQKLEDVLPWVFEQGLTPLFVLLDGVTDVRNVGAIARSAVCAGAHALVITQKNAAPINAEAVKSSAGALLNIPVCRETSMQAALDLLGKSGVNVYASSLQSKKMLYDMPLTEPCALLLGSEGEGVSPAVLRQADDTFIIPQTDVTNSFNVSVAAGIMLYEALRQRRNH
jgi:23S rRNA (guanosine2251-2'-O)-methyltransferase